MKQIYLRKFAVYLLYLLLFLINWDQKPWLTSISRLLCICLHGFGLLASVVYITLSLMSPSHIANRSVILSYFTFMPILTCVFLFCFVSNSLKGNKVDLLLKKIKVNHNSFRKEDKIQFVVLFLVLLSACANIGSTHVFFFIDMHQNVKYSKVLDKLLLSDILSMV